MRRSILSSLLSVAPRVILGTALFGTASLAQADSLQDLLAEKGVITRAEADESALGTGPTITWDGSTNVDYKDLGFTMNVKSLVQTRYTYSAQQNSEFSNLSSFDVRRARIAVSGDINNGDFFYYFQPDFVGQDDRLDLFNSVNNKKAPELQTTYVTWNPNEWLSVRMGQYKTLLSRQFNTVDGYEQFPERSIASDFLSLRRQQGVTASASFLDSRLQTWAGIYNGVSLLTAVAAIGPDNDGDGQPDIVPVAVVQEGANRPGFDNVHSGLAAVRINPLGEMNPYHEGDLDWTEDAALSFGGAYAYTEGNVLFRNIDPQGGFNIDVPLTTQSLSTDANFKWQGFSFHGEYLWGQDEVDTINTKNNPTGFYTQAGYFVVPKKLEIVGRFAQADCDGGQAVEGGAFPVTCPAKSGLSKVSETSAGLNYYFYKQNIKAQLAYEYLDFDVDDASSPRSHTVIFQLQFMG